MEIPAKRPVKIALVGTSCTGKTEIFNHYKRVFKGDPDVAFVDEAARDFFSSHPRIKHRFQERAQTKVQDLVLEREKAAHKRKPRLIFTDRSVLDAVACVAAEGNMVGAQRLFDRVRDWLPTYGHQFLMDPNDVPYKTDSIRTESPTQRLHIHKTFLALFRQMNIPHMLLSGSLRERINFINQVIDRAEGTGFNPIDPSTLDNFETQAYQRQKVQIMYPLGEARATSINYRGPKPLLQFVREGRLGIDSVIRISDYGRLIDPHYQIMPDGLELYDSQRVDEKVYQPEEILNLNNAPHGWTISS